MNYEHFPVVYPKHEQTEQLFVIFFWFSQTLLLDNKLHKFKTGATLDGRSFIQRDTENNSHLPLSLTLSGVVNPLPFEVLSKT